MARARTRRSSSTASPPRTAPTALTRWRTSRRCAPRREDQRRAEARARSGERRRLAALTARPELAGTGCGSRRMRSKPVSDAGPLEALTFRISALTDSTGSVDYDGLRRAVVRDDVPRWAHRDGAHGAAPLADGQYPMSPCPTAASAPATSRGKAADVVASSLNRIAGTRHVLDARHSITHVHDVAAQHSHQPKTLDAMMKAVKDGAERCAKVFA